MLKTAIANQDFVLRPRLVYCPQALRIVVDPSFACDAKASEVATNISSSKELAAPTVVHFGLTVRALGASSVVQVLSVISLRLIPKRLQACCSPQICLILRLYPPSEHAMLATAAKSNASWTCLACLARIVVMLV